ncbi:hypothetical protein E4U42_004711, partial [Claviceps africana]
PRRAQGRRRVVRLLRHGPHARRHGPAAACPHECLPPGVAGPGGGRPAALPAWRHPHGARSRQRRGRRRLPPHHGPGRGRHYADPARRGDCRRDGGRGRGAAQAGGCVSRSREQVV